MLYINNLVPKKIKEDVISYGLNFNGSSQFIQSMNTSEGGLDFNVFGKTQPFTFSFYGQNLRYGVNSLFMQGTITAGSLFIFFNTGNNSSIQVVMSGGSGGGNINALGNFFFTTAPTMYTVSYDGSGSASGLEYYIDGVRILFKQVFGNSLTGDFTSGAKKVQIGLFNTTYFRGVMEHMSIVDYVKSQTEIDSDVLLKRQTIGNGNWLMSPVESIYTDNGSTQLKTLSVPLINNPLPNSTAFVNDQGYKFNLNNYPSTLVEGIDLLQI